MMPKGNLIGQRDDAPAVDPEDGGVAPARITAKRAIHVSVRNEDGTPVTTFGADPVGLKNIAEDTINPATEDKQDDIITTLGDHTIELGGIGDGIAASNESLDNIEGSAANIDTALAAIKDTDGIKKITDPVTLGTGTSVIGTVNAQGAASGEWFEPHTEDFDSGAGTDSVSAFGIAVPADGGAGVINGDETNGLDVDVTRSALPTGAATSAKQDTIIGHVDGIEGHVDGIEGLLTTIDADTGNIATSVGVMDDWDESDRAKVNIIAGQAGVTAGAGAVAANTPRVTHASDDPVTTALQIMDDWDESDRCKVNAGNVAHDAADSGNPTKIGFKARDGLADTTLVAEGDRCDGISDVDGAQLVRADAPLGDTIIERLTDTGGSSTAFSNFGAVASTRNVITAYSVFNSSSTAGYVDIRDGTAGTVLWTIPLPAGGGANLSGLRIRGSANTALAYDVSAALSTVYISVQGYRTKA